MDTKSIYANPWVESFRLTPREVDVLACLLENQATKKIAPILSIGVKGVDTHVLNIMRKLNQSARANVIDFVKKSVCAKALHEHYLDLFAAFEFQKTLQTIRQHIKTKNVVCKIACKDKELKEHIESDLQTLNIACFDRKKEATIILIEPRESYYQTFFDVLSQLLPYPFVEQAINQFKAKISAPSDVGDTSKNSNQLQTSRYSKFFILHIILGLMLVGSVGYGVFAISNVTTPVSIEQKLPHKSMLIKRKVLLDRITKNINKKEKSIIPLIPIVGIGGSGKTTLARMWIQDYRNQYPHITTFEINAETKSSLAKSSEEFALLLAQTSKEKEDLLFIRTIEQIEKREKAILFFVQKCLKVRKKWILIFDNVESLQDIRNYLPQNSQLWGNGLILITTRNDRIKNVDFIKESDLISIDMLTEKESMELFTRIYFHKEPKELLQEQYEKTIQFLKYIPPFPLDISIAARYLANLKISYQEYIRQLYTVNQNFYKIQSQLISETSDYTKTRYNIITLAMNQVLKLNHDLVGPFLLISLIDSQNIYKDFIASYCGSHKADELLEYMHHYGLIHSKSHHSDVFLIHRSIQELIRNYMFDFLSPAELQTNLEKISNVFYACANQAIDSDEYSKMQYFLSHFLAFIKIVPSNTLSYHKISTQIGKIYSHVYFFAHAKPLVEANVHFFRNDNKNQHLLAKNLSILGRIEYYGGNFKKSEKLLEESIDIYKKCHENNKIEFAESLMSLGWTHLALGNYVRAKQFVMEGTDVFSEYYGIKHARTARCFFRLAGVYLKLGDTEKAKKYAIQSLEIFKNIGKNVKQQIAWAHYRLGDTYRMEGHYLKALKHLETAYLDLIKIEKMPGEIGPVWTMSCLCETYMCLGYIKKSEPVLKELINNTTQCYGENNILSAWFSTFLGRYYLALGNYTEAKKIFEKSFEIHEKELGADHIDSVFIQHCLAKTYLGFKLFDRAEKIYEKCIHIYRKHYGSTHVEYAKLLCDIAHLYILKKNFSKANSLLQEGSKILKTKNHDDIYRCYEYSGDLYHAKGDEKQAQAYYIKSFNYLTQHFPKNSAHIARLKSKIPFIKRFALCLKFF